MRHENIAGSAGSAGGGWPWKFAAWMQIARQSIVISEIADVSCESLRDNLARLIRIVFTVVFMVRLVHVRQFKGKIQSRFDEREPFVQRFVSSNEIQQHVAVLVGHVV